MKLLLIVVLFLLITYEVKSTNDLMNKDDENNNKTIKILKNEKDLELNNNIEEIKIAYDEKLFLYQMISNNIYVSSNNGIFNVISYYCHNDNVNIENDQTPQFVQIVLKMSHKDNISNNQHSELLLFDKAKELIENNQFYFKNKCLISFFYNEEKETNSTIIYKDENIFFNEITEEQKQTTNVSSLFAEAFFLKAFSKLFFVVLVIILYD